METEYKSDSDNEYIREPDPIKVERLIDYNDKIQITNNNINNNDDFDPDIIFQKELNDILELSKKEFEQIEIPKQTQIKEQLEIINKIKNKINKLLSFDKDNQYYYETILTILEMYSNNYIQVYETNEVEKSELLKLLRQTRLTKDEFILLENIIQ